MAAPWNKAGHYIFVLWFLLLSSLYLATPLTFNLFEGFPKVYHLK